MAKLAVTHPVTVDWDKGRIMCGDYVLAYIAVGVRPDMVACVDALAARFNSLPTLVEALAEVVRLTDLTDAGRANEFGSIQRNRAWAAARAALANAGGDA